LYHALDPTHGHDFDPRGCCGWAPYALDHVFVFAVSSGLLGM
jgi:hypothetical protein